MNRFVTSFLAAAALVLAASPLTAQTDTTFTYQGTLDDQGAAANGSFNLDFGLFNALSGGSQIGSTIVRNGVQVSDGLLTVELDFGARTFNNDGRWLEIAVNGSTLSPRQPINRTPYSLQTRGIYVDENNRVAIGTNTPIYPLQVESSSDYSIVGLNLSSTGRGVYGFVRALSGVTYGGYFESRSTSGRGVYGDATATTGRTYGGRFRSASVRGRGVFGFATAATGLTYGGLFDSQSTDGRGVFGWATAASGTTYGVLGRSNSSDGIGVFGETRSTNGTTYGGRFESDSRSGHGVFGLATATTGITYGGRFESNSTTGRGVFGLIPVNTGVNYAVVGHTNSPSGFDFWASGAGTNYGSPSSRRFKSNIVPISDPLDKLAQLQGVYFDWDDEHGGNHDVGMIAEEVGEVMPEIVNYEENGIDAIGMDYSKMTPLLVEAVNALRSESNRRLAEKDEEISELREQLFDLQQIVERLASNQEKESM